MGEGIKKAISEFVYIAFSLSLGRRWPVFGPDEGDL